MEDRSTEKDQYDDLASLFLPDILHPISTENINIKQEELEQNSDIGNLLGGQNDTTKGNDNNENFSNFMSNNNFINNIGSLSQGGNIASNPVMSQSGHINHYANFVPIEAAASIQQPHHQLHRMFAPLNHQHQQFFPSSHTQPQNSGGAMRMGSPSNADLNWFSNPPNGLDTFSMDNKHLQSIDGNFRDLDAFSSPNPYASQAGIPSSFPNMDRSGVLKTNEADDETSTSKQKDVKDKDKTRKKAKKSRAKSSLEVHIDYKPHKLTRLLDLKKLENTSSSDYKIVDKDNNEIQMQFQSYLTGRFFTNDTDNNNFILSKLENNGEKDNIEISRDPNIKMDPKVISCYRRNYIQISMNMNLSGFSNDDEENNKVLKLQTNEYGYSITRVIKWFKVEIFANTNVSEIRNIPIVIYDDNNLRDKERSKDEIDTDENNDFINPISIDKAQSTITLNESIIKNSEIDNYYTVKKLQFKNATPNNGNLTFQNYYHLKIKVSAIVADLYYDDYIDEDYSSNTYNERNEVSLFELVSEPIIVRGRNPSFYADRKDILIKGRSINSRESFIIAGQETKTENEEANSIEENEDIPEDDDVEDIQEDYDEDEDGETETESSSNKRLKSVSPSKSQVHNNQLDRTNPPLLYNATPSSSINLKSMLDNSTSKINLVPLNKTNSRYKYFPISNVYYLPPINAVYFPHRAHQQMNREHDAANSKSPSIENDDTSCMINISSPQRRKNSNVYFR